MRIIAPIVACVAVLLTACPRFISGAENHVFATQQARAALSAMLQDRTSSEDAPFRKSLSQMYADRAYAPQRFAAGQPTSQASALTLGVGRAGGRGGRAAGGGGGRRARAAGPAGATGVA